jgi:hypothetical protein
MNILEKGVIPRVKGGIGNQMFIVAAAYVVHKTTGMPLYILENPPNIHNTKKHDYNKTIFKKFGIHLSVLQDNVLSFGYRQYSPGAFSAWFPEHIRPGTFMDDYFQFYPALSLYEESLRKLFLDGLSVPQEDYSKYAFLHIRRGDYLKFSDIHYIQPLAYYEKALQQLMSMRTADQILVFSDDIEWVQSQDFFKNPIMKIMNIEDELDTLTHMSHCKAGAICANSTFSWWGAFLGSYGERSPVFVPKKWINQPIVKLFPDEWIVI